MIVCQHGSSLRPGGAWCVLSAEEDEDDWLLLEVVHVVSVPEFVVVEVKLRLSGSSAASSADGCIATADVEEEEIRAEWKNLSERKGFEGRVEALMGRQNETEPCGRFM